MYSSKYDPPAPVGNTVTVIKHGVVLEKYGLRRRTPAFLEPWPW